MGNLTENGHLLKQLTELFLFYKKNLKLTVLATILSLNRTAEGNFNWGEETRVCWGKGVSGVGFYRLC